MKKYLIILIGTITLLLSIFTGCGSSSISSNDTITLIGTADLQGMMERSEQDYEINGSRKKLMGGGIDRIASIFKRVKEENPLGTFIVSSGDDLMGRYFHTFKGEAIFTLMNESGYALFAPGNHEFDKGPELFAYALKYADFNMLCSDLAVEGTSLDGTCTKYRIIETRGARIGFFSLMTEDLHLITSPGNVKHSAPNFQSAEEMVKTLRGEKCNIIIALTHVGLDRDKEIAKNVSGIDVIFGGHSHEYTKDIVHVNDTLIVNAGEQGSDVVKLQLPLDDQHHIKKSGAKYDLIPVIDPVPSDPEVNATLANFKNQLPASVVLGKTTVEWDLTVDALRKNESNVADMINDLLRNKFDVDIVMNNAGAFRGKKVYPPGNITDTRLHEIDEFSNNAYILDIEGKYLRQILEHSSAHYGEGGLMQVSGVRYTIDLSKEAQVVTQKSDGSWVIEKEGNRVSDIEIVSKEESKEPLQDEKTYQILSNAYIVNHAGDGYFWFKQYGKNQKNTYTTFYTIMANYLEKNKIMNPKPLDGRIKILN